MNGSKVPTAEWELQETGLSTLVQSQESAQGALEEWQHAPTDSGVGYGNEVDMRISQLDYVAQWPPATPCRWEDSTAASPSYIYPSQPLVSSQEDLWNGYAMSYHGTEHVGDQQTNVASSLQSFGSHSQLNKRDWSKVDSLSTGLEDQSTDYLSSEGPQQKRPRVIATTYQPAWYPLGEGDQHEKPSENNTQVDSTMHGPMKILEDYMGIATLYSAAPVPSQATETRALTPLPRQTLNQQTYHNGKVDASSPIDLDNRSIPEGGDPFAYDVEPTAYHATSFLGAADSCQTYPPLDYPHCNGISDTATTRNSAGPSQCDITESEEEAAEECRCSDGEELPNRECDTCFGMVSSLPPFHIRLVYIERMRWEPHIHHLRLCTSFCWQCREQLVSTLYLCALYYAFNYCADLRQSYKLMLLNYAHFPPMMLV